VTAFRSYNLRVTRWIRPLFLLCVIAGLSAGSFHSASHQDVDPCASHCGSDHTDQDLPVTEPHDHPCCHLPAADRATSTLSLPAALLAVLMEIPADRAMVPDEPVREPDTPPLI